MNGSLRTAYRTLGWGLIPVGVMSALVATQGIRSEVLLTFQPTVTTPGRDSIAIAQGIKPQLPEHYAQTDKGTRTDVRSSPGNRTRPQVFAQPNSDHLGENTLTKSNSRRSETPRIADVLDTPADPMTPEFGPELSVGSSSDDPTLIAQVPVPTEKDDPFESNKPEAPALPEDPSTQPPVALPQSIPNYDAQFQELNKRLQELLEGHQADRASLEDCQAQLKLLKDLTKKLSTQTRVKKLEEALKALDQRLDKLASTPQLPIMVVPPVPQLTPVVNPSAPATPASPPVPPISFRRAPDTPGGQHFHMQLREANIREAVQKLGQFAQVSVAVSPALQGTMTANLQNVDAEQALQAIAQLGGAVIQKEGPVTWLRTPEEVRHREQQGVEPITRTFHPQHLPAADLARLVHPLLSPAPVGLLSLSQPENTPGHADSEQRLLIQDRPAVVERVSQLIAELDVAPRTIVMDVVVLAAPLRPNSPTGINLAEIGTPEARQVIPFSVATQNPASVPLKAGWLRGNVQSFVHTVAGMTELSVLGTPQVLVTDRRAAAFSLTSQASYPVNSGNENTPPTMKAAQSTLRLSMRPMLVGEGRLRLDVIPELQSSRIHPVTGEPDVVQSQLHSQLVMSEDQTIVLSGLTLEPIGTALSQTWWKTGQAPPSELIILITPHVVQAPPAGVEKTAVPAELPPAAVSQPIPTWQEQGSELAWQAWQTGDWRRAIFYARETLRVHPENQKARWIISQWENAGGAGQRWRGRVAPKRCLACEQGG